MRYTKLYINNSVSNKLSQGWSTADVIELFLSMKMANDLPEESLSSEESLSPYNIRKKLIDNGVIDQKDINLDYILSKLNIPILAVQLSPSCTLYAELAHRGMQVTINQRNFTTIPLKHMTIAGVAQWIANQKAKLPRYMEDFEDVLKNQAKRAKCNHLALLAIKAIFTEAMKDYHDIEYVFIEQKRRVRIRVKLPDSNLGVFIDGWWGSYKQRLPAQIEELKFLIEAHSKTRIKDFFVARH